VDGHRRGNPPVDFEKRLDDQIRDAARRAECARWPRTAGGSCAAGVTTVEEVLSVTTAKEVESTTKNQGQIDRARRIRRLPSRTLN
jgi:hypothetical protein